MAARRAVPRLATCHEPTSAFPEDWNESGILETIPTTLLLKAVTVTDISSVEIPKPLLWQDFQRCCVPLFRNIIRDPQLQEWGREGQRQQGIDLFGLRDRDPHQPIGIQCKRIDKPITEKTIRVEIEKARKLTPDLSELIFATTSERDAKIQAVAAQITKELRDGGWSCRITVMGWQDLRLEIVKYPDALDAFLPTGRVFDQPILQEIRQTDLVTQAKLDLLVETVEGLCSSRTVFREEYDVELEPEAQSERASLHAEITAYRNLLRKGQAKVPLEELTRLLGRNPPPYARYRILSNISAIHINSGRYGLALDFSRQAYALRPTDVKARTNLAFAELASGNRAAAARGPKQSWRIIPRMGPRLACCCRRGPGTKASTIRAQWCRLRHTLPPTSALEPSSSCGSTTTHRGGKWRLMPRPHTPATTRLRGSQPRPSWSRSLTTLRRCWANWEAPM